MAELAAKKVQSGEVDHSVEDILSGLVHNSKGKENPLIKVLTAIADASAWIGDHLRTVEEGHAAAGTSNEFGDGQLAIDLQADQSIFSHLKDSGVVATASSEEKPEEVALGGEGYSVAFDPLDGSSVIEPNFAVGSIFGVWPGSRLIGVTGKEQAAAVITTYGPRTTMIIAIPEAATGQEKGSVCVEMTWNGRIGHWYLTRPKLSIASSGKVFAPGNLRATADCPAYKKLFDYWVDERYTLRYTGGMVPDVNHILIKGKGVFSNVPSPAAKAKLRLLYECAPIALIIEAAGGASCIAPPPAAAAAAAAAAAVLPSGGGGVDAVAPCSVLDVEVKSLEQRLGVCYGGVAEVDIFKRFMFAA